MANKPVIYQRSKHIDIKFRFMCDEMNNGSILLEYIVNRENVADVFTKPMTGIELNFQKDYSR